MAKISRLLIIAILSIALVAIAGTASAAVTFHVEKIQTNGVYHGVPTLKDNLIGSTGYEYTLIPDGTYTAIGYVENDGDTPVFVGVDVGMIPDRYYKDFTVPAAQGSKPGKATFSVTGPADSVDDFNVWVTIWEGVDETYKFKPYDLSGVDYVDAPQSPHTVDQGPMSNAVAIYSNGKLTYNGLPQYWAYI